MSFSNPTKSFGPLLAAGFLLFAASLVYIFYLLEADPLPASLTGTAFGDAVAFAHSARVKYLHGVWYRPDMDDWRPVFMVPIHSFLVWLGFQLQGLTLTGLRLSSFVLVSLAKVLALWFIWREFRSTRCLLAGLVLLTVLAPLNELSRFGTMDPAQLGLYMLTLAGLAAASQRGSRIIYLLAGVFCGITFLLKTSALLWPFFPYAYFYFRAKLNHNLPLLLEPPAGQQRLKSWGRLALVYAPTLLLAVDHFVTQSNHTFRIAMVAWPLLPILYFQLDLLHGMALRRRAGKEGWRLLFGCWLLANALTAIPLLLEAWHGQGGSAPFVLLRDLLPLLAVAYFVLRTAIYRGWAGLWAGDKTAVIWTHLGLALIGVLALVFWIIPHLDGIIYFSWRMFGPSARLVLPEQTGLLMEHVLGFLNYAWRPAMEAGILPFHGLWAFGLLGWMMLMSITRRERYSDLEVMFPVMLGVFFLQVIFFDMLWHRYYGLMLMGVLGLFKMAQAAWGWRSLHLVERMTPLRAMVFAYGLFILSTRYIYRYDFSDMQQKFLALGLFLILGMGLAWLVARRHLRATVLVLALTGLSLAPSAVLGAWRFFQPPTFVIRQASQELGRVAGTARMIGFYEYSLYNRTESGYIGNYRGQVKPVGFQWKGRSVPSLYNAVYASSERSLGGRLMRLLDQAYPGFLKRWDLPADYAMRYHSRWLLTPRSRPSANYLVIGAGEDEVFIQQGYLDMFKPLSQLTPETTGQVIELPKSPHMMEESPEDVGQSPVLRLVRLNGASLR